jgi:hypothetical protein
MRFRSNELTRAQEPNRLPARRGILGRLRRSRLARSTTAATLPMMAASIIPMIGIVGGAVDMTRAYLIKTRLQQACDAGVLAARRSMDGQTLESADETSGQNFFNVNLRDGSWGAEDVEFAMTGVVDEDGDPTGAVRGDASAEVPLTLMKVFYPNGRMTMVVDCEAELNVTNNDIMFVLDITGSMSCLTSDDYNSQCRPWVGSNTHSSGNYVTEKANSRMDGLRAAVEDFAVTLANATPDSARLRIGFVPYGSGVRVEEALTGTGANAGLTAVSNPFRSSYTYRSREARFQTDAHVANTPTSNTYWQYYRGSLSPQVGTSAPPASQTNALLTSANCLRFMNNQSFTQNSVTFNGSPTPASGSGGTTYNSGGPAPNDTIATTFPDDNSASSSGSSSATASAPHAEWGWSGAPVTSGTNRSCRRRRTDTTTTYQERYSFTNWESEPNMTYDATSFLAGSTIPLVTTNFSTSSTARVSVAGVYSPVELGQMVSNGTAFNMTTTDSAWDGCIIERVTGTDDVDTAPTATDATKWAPAWPGVTFSGVVDGSTTTGGGGTNAAGTSWTLNYACPKTARRLFNVTTANLADVRNYVNVLNGVQTASPFDFLPHGKTYHDIGMIWGVRLMSPEGMFSSDHGAAPNGRPVNRHIIFMTDGVMDTGTDSYSAYGYESSGDAAHETRFLAACQAAKDRGISVWVVSFAQALTTTLSNCADDGQAFQANDSDELQEMFQTIAQRIAELRITE